MEEWRRLLRVKGMGKTDYVAESAGRTWSLGRALHFPVWYKSRNSTSLFILLAIAFYMYICGWNEEIGFNEEREVNERHRIRGYGDKTLPRPFPRTRKLSIEAHHHRLEIRRWSSFQGVTRVRKSRRGKLGEETARLSPASCRQTPWTHHAGYH